MSMKFALIVGLALTTLAAPALAAEEDWVVVGGDGSALGYDRASIKKDSPSQTTLRYAVYSATALPPPPSMAASTMFGFTGLMTFNCQDKTAKPGETTYYFAYGGERTVAAAPKTAFEKFKPGAYQAYFADVACGGRKTLDSYTAKGRAEGLALLKKIAATPHVTNAGAKGWTYAIGDAARLLAVDTSSTKRVGDSVLQPEIAWMRKPQSTNGQSWRYYYLVTEYDCAKGRRRGNGAFRIAASGGARESGHLHQVVAVARHRRGQLAPHAWRRTESGNQDHIAALADGLHADAGGVEISAEGRGQRAGGKRAEGSEKHPAGRQGHGDSFLFAGLRLFCVGRRHRQCGRIEDLQALFSGEAFFAQRVEQVLLERGDALRRFRPFGKFELGLHLHLADARHHGHHRHHAGVHHRLHLLRRRFLRLLCMGEGGQAKQGGN
jgi:hypothetical protein